MKTKINTFFEKTPLILMYVIFTLISGLFMFLILKIFDLKALNILIFKISLAYGIVMGLFFILILDSLRKSKIFWKEAEIIGKLIDAAETKEEINNLNGQWSLFIKLANGAEHYREINRLYLISSTKYKYLK
jgi:hypothetical protein